MADHTETSSSSNTPMSSFRKREDAPATNNHWIQQQRSSSSSCSDIHGGNDVNVPCNNAIDLEAGTRISETKDNSNDRHDDNDDRNQVSHKVVDLKRKQMDPMEEHQQSFMGVASNASTRQANTHNNDDDILDSSTIVAASTSVIQRDDRSLSLPTVPLRSANVTAGTTNRTTTGSKLHAIPVSKNSATTRTAKHSRMIVDVDEYMNDDDDDEDEEILLDSTVIISNVSTATPQTRQTDGRSTSLRPIIEGAVPTITPSSSDTILVEVRDEPIRDENGAAPPQQHHPTIPPITRTIFDVDDEIEEDFPVPSLTTIPQRTKSQEMALKAVLQDDMDVFDTDTSLKEDEKKKAIWVSSNASITSKQTTTTKTSTTASIDGTEDLFDDEIGAIIPPPLQRQTRRMHQHSTPGAYPVTPTSSSMIVSNNSAHRNRRTYPIVDCEQDDPTGESDIISATLVEDDTYCGLNNNTTYMSDMSHTNPTTVMLNDSPILVHAERLWWKRRLVLCLSVWMLCAIAVVSVSVTLAVTYMLETEDESPETTPEQATSSLPVASVPIITNTPTRSPFDIRTVITGRPTLSPFNNRTVVSESPTLVPTASSNSFSNETGIRTSMNAVSLGVVTTCTNDVDVSSFDIELSCGGKIHVHQQENVLCYPEQTSAGSSTKVKCKWNNTPSYPMTTTNEVLYQQITGQVLFSCQGFESRDVLPVSKITNGTITNCSSSTTSSSTTPLQATSYMSLGSFCEDDDMNYSVRSFVSKCEKGKRWDPIKFGAILDVIFGSDLPDSFCYDSGSCSLPGSVSWLEEQPPQQCTISSIPNVVVSSTTVFDGVIKLCADPFMEVEDIQIDKMWNIASTTLDSTKYIEVIVLNEFN